MALNLTTGEWVEVRSKEEILATLDKRGQLDGLPFMPPMFNACGKRFRVYRRAHKTCDTVNDYKGLKMEAAVHLEGSRCMGEAHGGCEAACLIFWKEVWLKRVAGPEQATNAGASSPVLSERTAQGNRACTENDVIAGTQSPNSDPQDPTFVCQATRLPDACKPLPWWNLRQYVEDYTSGNVGIWRMFRGFFYLGYVNLSNLGIGLGRPMRWLYDRVQSVLGGVPYPRRQGTIPKGQRTPTVSLNLQPGELVRVKSYEEVLATLDENNRNRGLYFDAEVVPFCGGVYRVLSRVTKIIHEKTGKMIKLKGCVILSNVFCQSRYSNNRIFCPRALYQFMQEIWLERVPIEANGKAPESDVTWESHPAQPISDRQPACARAVEINSTCKND